MYTRHNEVPVFEYRKGLVQAMHYNHVQVALKRLGGAIELPLPRLTNLMLILQADAWIIVDQSLNDLPIAAWTDFEIIGRHALQQPVPCTIRLFHSHAGLLLKRVLEAMELLLGEQLLDQNAGKDATILPFGKKD